MAKFNFRAERNTLVFKKSISLEKIKDHKKEFQMEIKNQFQALSNNKDSIEVKNGDLLDVIRESAEKAGSTKKTVESKYYKVTSDLMKI